jgi:hypothetical protein
LRIILLNDKRGTGSGRIKTTSSNQTNLRQG